MHLLCEWKIFSKFFKSESIFYNECDTELNPKSHFKM